MKKNQKYTKEEMYLAIELWQESKKTKAEYCRQNKISGDTFKYWYNKYRKEKAIQEPVKTHSFIPVDITKPENTPESANNITCITITYPTGVQVTCPTGIGVQQLKALINL